MLQAASVHKELVLRLRTSDPSVTPFRSLRGGPVNLVVGTMAGTLPWANVQATGMNCLSLGSALYLRFMGKLAESAKEPRVGDLITASGEAPSSSTSLSRGELHQAMSKARPRVVRSESGV